jgi:hypothetical protein
LLSATWPGLMPSMAIVAFTTATISGFLYSTRITSFHMKVLSAEIE